MLDVVLTYSTDEGSQEVLIESGRVSFGRGDVGNRIDDDGLSRLHATVYREGDNVWIVDENSTNGTFVNGAQVQGAGTPLSDPVPSLAQARVPLAPERAGAPISDARGCPRTPSKPPMTSGIET